MTVSELQTRGPSRLGEYQMQDSCGLACLLRDCLSNWRSVPGSLGPQVPT